VPDPVNRYPESQAVASWGFPWQLTDDVYLCGYNDEASFGAHSYFVVREHGNLLVDSPRYTVASSSVSSNWEGIPCSAQPPRRCADAQRYADRFAARVWIHEADADAAPYATDILRGDDIVFVAPGVRPFPCRSYLGAWRLKTTGVISLRVTPCLE